MKANSHAKSEPQVSKWRSGSEYRQASAVVDLACGHRARFPSPAPAQGETVWCYRCGDYKTVIGSSAAASGA